MSEKRQERNHWGAPLALLLLLVIIILYQPAGYQPVGEEGISTENQVVASTTTGSKIAP